MATIQASSLKGRAVVSSGEGEKVGSVADLFFDLEKGLLVAFHISPGLIGQLKTLLATSIKQIGADAIIVPSHESLTTWAGPNYQNAVSFDLLEGRKVVSESGALLGTLGDIELDPQSMQVVLYEMRGSLWDTIRHKTRGFTPADSVRFGKDVIVVPDAVAARLNGEAPPPAAPPPPAAESK